MLAPTLTPQEQEVYNQAYIDALEFVDPVILDKSLEQPRVFVNMIPRGTYALGRGLIQKQDVFYGDKGPQGALLGWNTIQVSRPASGEDPGYNACKQYDAELIEHGWDEVSFTGYQRNRRSYDLCIADMKWKDRFQEQIALVYGNLAEIIVGEWDNLAREAYIRQSKKYVIAGGTPNATTFTYDPFTSSEITLASGTTISTLQWNFMKWFHIYLSLKARASATGTYSGQPTWTLVIDPDDFDDMIRRDASLVTTFNYARPNVLLQNYGQIDMFKGFTLAYDMHMPRFNVESDDGTTLTMDRVAQYVSEDATLGYKVDVNTEYLNAQFALGIIFLKNTLELQVPPAGPPSPGGGTKFGATPGMNGQFAWLNIQHRTENPFNEIGHYFARMQAFIKPLRWNAESIVFLYKRCVSNPIVLCEPEVANAEPDATPDGTNVLNTSVATAIVGEEETAALYTQVEVTLASFLELEAPARVTCRYGVLSSPTTVTATIAQDNNAPTYRIVFDTAANWVTLIGGAGNFDVSTP